MPPPRLTRESVERPPAAQGAAVQRPHDRRAGPRNAALSPDKQPVAARAIASALADLDLGPRDLSICGGACGGDLLFAEAALARSARLELYIPFDEPTFLEKSVDFADADWRARFFSAKARAVLHVLPSERRPAPAGRGPL